MKITLSLWDIGGQERFEFFKTDFFKGTAAVGLVIDLSRPETFKRVDEYLGDIRERAGNIPIILVGNKSDLLESMEKKLPRERIIQKVNQLNLIDYIKTSALKNDNVDILFRKLALLCLLDLHPRIGEIIDPSKHFRFKVLLLGDAFVGKSSLIKTIVNKMFDNDYKLTVGLDLMVQDFEFPYEDLTEETREIIKIAISKYKKLTKLDRKKEKLA